MKNKADQVYALLADGTTVEIRPAGPDDFDAVKAMHEAMSPDNAYMRFFNLSRMAGAEEARRTCQEPGPDHGALLALCGGEVVGVASFYVTDKEKRTAEIAFAVADHMHHRGIATLLLEHLVSFARSRQITTFTAETLFGKQADAGRVRWRGAARRASLRGRGLRDDLPAAHRGRRHRAGQLPECRGRT